MVHQGMKLMLLFQLEKLYVGTLAKNSKSSVLFQGHILCIRSGNDHVFDLLNGEFYYYPGPKCFCINDLGSTYAVNLEDRFENISMHSTFRMRTLLVVAQILNDYGYTINIPNSLLCKVKRK
jgi:hypothetical protein